MIQRYEYNSDPCVEDYVERNDGTVVYYTDHLRAMSALEEENKRLRQEFEGFKEYVDIIRNTAVPRSIAAKGEGT